MSSDQPVVHQHEISMNWKTHIMFSKQQNCISHCFCSKVPPVPHAVPSYFSSTGLYMSYVRRKPVLKVLQ